MKKFFTLFAAASMMLAANAESLTLYDGQGFDYYVPINSLFLDEADEPAQVIFPAEDLTAMVGKSIKSMTFYTDNYGCYMDGGLLTISLGETDSKVMTAWVENLTAVATISMVKSTGAPVEVVIDFTTPYVYEGGNLVFESYTTQAGSYGMTYFMGVRTDYCTGMAYAYGSPYERFFLPKTTFEYEENAPVEDTEAPSISADTQQGVHAYFVTVTPSEQSDLYYRYCKDGGEWSEWLPYDDVIPFTEDGYYQVEAYAQAAGKNESLHVSCSFTVTPRTGLDELSGDKAVARVRFFNAMGQEMAQPNGMTIVVTTYTDGTSSAVKVMK